jgi:hypothetical protein
MTAGVQTSIGSLAAGYDGQLVLGEEVDEVVTAIAEDTIAFGRAVEAGSGTGGVVLYNTSLTPLGVAIRQVARQSGCEIGRATNSFIATECARVYKAGRVRVSVNGTGAIGDALTLIENTGQFSTAGADGTHNAVNAVLASAVGTSNDLALVDFDFNVHNAVALAPHASSHALGASDQVSADATSIQGFAVSTTDPTNGQILKFNGTSYVPAADATE